MANIVFFCADERGAIPAHAGEAESVVACEAGVGKRRTDLQRQRAIGNVVLADVLNNAAARRTQIHDELICAEFGVGESDGATAGTRKIGVDRVGGGRQ